MRKTELSDESLDAASGGSWVVDARLRGSSAGVTIAFPDVCWTPPQTRLETEFGDIAPMAGTQLVDDDLDAVQGGLDVTAEMGVQTPPVRVNGGEEKPVFVRKTPPRPISAGPGHLGPRACVHEKRGI